MSTVAPTQLALMPVDPGSVPSSLYRVTLEQFEAMVDSSIFTGRDRVQPINGFLVARMTQNDAHSTADILCGNELDRVIPPGWHVRPGKPIRIPNPTRDSRPEPDRCVARGGVRDYSRRSPGPADIALVVQVSDSTLDDDRKQSEIYSWAGIPFYWIISLVDSQVEVYSNPGPSGYQSLEVLASGHVLTVIIDGAEVGEIPVADILL